MLTSKGGFLDKFKGKLAGSSAYLTKPFEPKDLITIVQKHIAG
jgi:twitching motility two-component system response regulator PilG